MKSYELNRNSWHYRLANFQVQRVGDSSNICEYTRAVFSGAVLGLLMLGFVALLTSVIGYGIYGIGASIFTLSNMLNPASMLVIGIVLGIVFIYIFAMIKDRLDDMPVRPESNSFPALAYRKFKDRTCFKINFK